MISIALYFPGAHASHLEIPSPENPALQTHAPLSALPAGENASPLQAWQLEIPSPKYPASQTHDLIDVLPVGEVALPMQAVQVDVPSP